MRVFMRFLKLVIIIFVFNGIFIVYTQSLTENSLPLRAKNFLNYNFPGNNIESVSLYQNGAGYDVNIDFGYQFIFYNTGLWKEISIINEEAKKLGIPRSCIHKNMINVIDNEYPSSKITYIERKNKTFTVILDDKYQLEISGYGIIINKSDVVKK